MKFVPKAKLETQARDLLNSVDAMEAPVPIEVVAHRLGLVVDEVPLGDEISGVLVVHDGGGTVGINSGHPTVRKRFTLAHEVAHYVLHGKTSDLFIDKNYTAFRDSRSKGGSDRAEIQANQFAAALLMPESLIRTEIASETIDLGEAELLEDLAQRFQVSSQAMAYRIANLGLFATEA